MSISFAGPTECSGCISDDCSSPVSPYGPCGSANVCYKITSEGPGSGFCDISSKTLLCDSSKLDKPSNHADFGSDGFVYTSSPYYCNNFMHSGTYAWKTCYENSVASNWTSTVLACDSSRTSSNLRRCGSSTYGTAAGACEVLKGTINFYCPGGATSWKTSTEAVDSCSGACTAEGGIWDSGTTPQCCYGTKDFVFSDGSGNVCYDGSVTTCDSSSGACIDAGVCEDINSGDIGINYFGTEPNGNCCGDDGSEYYEDSLCDVGVTCDGGSYACITALTSCIWSGTEYSDQVCSGGLFCDSGTWKHDADSSPAACECVEGLGYWGGSTNNCCESGDYFDFNSTASCNDGVIEFKTCETDSDLCGTDNEGKLCLKDGSSYSWSTDLCTATFACKDNGDSTYSSIGTCSSKDGWFGGGNTAGCGDDPSADERDYSCNSGACTYTTSQTLDCDSLDGWYGGGNTAGCGDDPRIIEKDSFVSTVTWQCVTPINCQGTADDSCDTGDICSNSCTPDYLSETGGTDYFWTSVSGGNKPDCESLTTSETLCSSINSIEFLDAGKNYYVPGYVDDYYICSSEVGACIAQKLTDTCEGDIIHEYWIDAGDPTNYKGENSVSCSNSFDELCATASRTTNAKYFKDYSCATNTSGGYCSFIETDFDDSQTLCESASYCSLNWVTGSLDDSSTNCCGDDSREFYIPNGGTDACCDDSSDCSLNGDCFDISTFQTTANQDYCFNSVVKSASAYQAECTQWDAGSGYYAIDTGTADAKWATAEEAKDTCQYACLEVVESWNDNTIVSGTSNCCYEGSEETVTTSGTAQYLCDGNGWLSTNDNLGISPSGTNGFDFSRYLSDGSDWIYCDGTFAELTVNDIKYVCTSGGWQNEACAQDGDSVDLNYCEVTCGGTWIDSRVGTSEACCGNTLDDDYFIGNSPYTQVCDGLSGLKVCDAGTTCSKATLGVDDYYCYSGSWSQNSDFEGSYAKDYSGDTGCCKETQCWGGDSCYTLGDSKGLEICTETGWETCSDTNQCNVLSTTTGVYYCSDTGWSLQTSELCSGGSGLCINDVCLNCPGDYSYGQEVNGYFCTTTGFSQQECVTDTDCVSYSCSTGACVSGVCQDTPVTCGTPCDTGVCDGSSTCADVLDVGAACVCDSNCLSGLYCGDGVCTEPKNAGDGVCQLGECSAYPDDCTLSECSGDGVCSYSLGETCDNTDDCACSFGYCDTSQGNEWGCVTPICGNNVCELGECSYCANDCSVDFCGSNGVCDVALGETCDNSDDCSCGIIFETETIPVLRLGEAGSIQVYVENTGNAPIVIDLVISSEGFEISGSSKKIYLSPYERKEVSIEVTANKTGTQRINFLAKSAKGTSLPASPVEVTVKERTVWETFLDAFKRSPIYPIFEALDIVVFVVGGIWGFFKFVIPRKKYTLNPYGVKGQTAYPRYYNQSQTPYAPPQQQNYGRR